MIDVERLLRGDIPDRYNDKIFWYASKVNIHSNQVDVYIDNQNLVGLDDIDLDIKKVSDLRNIRQKGSNFLENVLVSSGSFLFVNNKLIVTQRELDTKYDPGYWTTPAGRCDRTIFDTAIKETVEEIEIIENNYTLFPEIAKQFILHNEHIKFYQTLFRDKQFPIKTYKVCVFLNNSLIEKCQAWMYVSTEANTIEFRIPIFAKLNEYELTFVNPEFGTDTGLKSIDELKKLEVVPALKQLIEGK